jgi:hypothetical protein
VRSGNGLDTPLIAVFAKPPDRTRADDGISWNLNDQATTDVVGNETGLRETAAAIESFGERVINRKARVLQARELKLCLCHSSKL